PAPKVIAWYPTSGRAVAMTRPLERDRAVDESGNQVTAFGRIGGRPMNLEEMQKLYFKNGKVWGVSNKPMSPAAGRSRGGPGAGR
ncbi:MAG: hypothetical protein R3E53_00005, partial [Myxococcota bacterium]